MLAPGTRVGPYEVVSWLAAGGMGEVYRARDVNLGRVVALKTLPEELAGQPERLARLKQEARILASFNHPAIATLHGLERSDDGVPVLVMELVEGDSLSDRLQGRPLPIREAFAIGRQVALALEAAHENGVLHRDLKPANIRLTPDGRVKLLDFGLAKVVEGLTPNSALPTRSGSPSAAGTVLGTAPYMSPEQARGQELDRRSDVWAFGCVLYEMLSGRRAFAGATFSDTVAAILEHEPDWAALPAETPAAARRLLRRCLQKQKDQRLRDAGDARLELEEMLAGSTVADTESGGAPAPAREPRLAGRAAPIGRWPLVLAAAAILGAGLWALSRSPPVAERSVLRLALTVPPGETIADGAASAVAISPDGRQVAYVAARDGRSQIYVRTLDRLDARPIPGTAGGEVPFFSPDGHWLAFFAGAESKLKKVPLAGGAPIPLCDVPLMRGASWGRDGSIVFTRDGASGIEWVSAEGGNPQILTTLDPGGNSTSHRFPEFLPDGQGVLFTAKATDTESWDDARIEAVSTRTRESSVLITGGTNPRYASGHLVYGRGGHLWAAPFDPARLAVTGPSVRVQDGVSSSNQSGSVDFALSQEGSLAYVPGTPRGVDRRLVRVNRVGRVQALMDSRRPFLNLSVSPDGSRLALSIEGANDQIWIYDLERGTLTKQTLRGNNGAPMWTPDGRYLTFTSTREGPSNLFRQPADGSGPAERLTTSPHWQMPQSWSPDGANLLFSIWWPNPDVWLLPRDGQAKPLLDGPFGEDEARFSPNGRWLAYVSDESGRREVYVRPFPGAGARWLVSTDGGRFPVWARNGRELYYRRGDRTMAVSVTTEGAFRAAKPVALFEAKVLAISSAYDVTPEGDFLIIEPGETDRLPAQVNVVLSWMQEVASRPASR